MPSADDLFSDADRYIRTISGRKFHLHGNDPDEIDIDDIAHALSHMGRFTGHTSRFYSVAEHSVLVADIVRHLTGGDDPWLMLSALMHDSTEAYLADISAPFKGALTNYKDLEQFTWVRIAHKYRMHPDMDPIIKKADWIALFAEAIELQPNGEHHTWVYWDEYGPMAREYLRSFGIPNSPPRYARRLFLREFQRWTAATQSGCASPSKEPIGYRVEA